MEAGHQVSNEILRVLRSAKRAAQRGTGATKKAATADVELISEREDS